MAGLNLPTTHGNVQGDQEVPGKSSDSTPHDQRDQYQPRSERVTPRLGLVTPGGGVVLHCEGAIIDTIDGVPQVGENKHGLSQLAMIDLESGKTVLNTYCYYPSNATPLIKAHLPRQLIAANYDEIHPSVNISNPQAFYTCSNPRNGALPVDYVLQCAESIIETAGFIVGHGLDDLAKMLKPLDLDRWDQCDTQADPDNEKVATGSCGRQLRLRYHQILWKSVWNVKRDALVDAERTRELYLLSGAALLHQQAQKRDEEAENDDSEAHFECMSTAPDTANPGEPSANVTVADSISGPASNLRPRKRRYSRL